MRTKDIDDAGFQEASANARRLEARKNELLREFSDLNHRRQQQKLTGNAYTVTDDVANLLVGFHGDAVATVDNSRNRLEEIQSEIGVLEKALHAQEEICVTLRLQVERAVRAKALAGHQELARKVLKHRAEGRALRSAILAFEAEHLKGTPHGYPLEFLQDASDELRYGPLDDLGTSTSSLLEKKLAAYLKRN